MLDGNSIKSREMRKMKPVKLFVDIDGVVAMAQPLEKYEEKGIFRRIPPIRGSSYFLNVLKTIAVCSNCELVAITKTFKLEDHEEQADDKRYWIGYNFPNIFDEVVCVKPTDKKSSYISDTMLSILIDDYGVNCQDWIDNCGVAVQIFESKTKKWLTAIDHAETLDLINSILRD